MRILSVAAAILFSASLYAGDWTVKDGETPEVYYKGKLKTRVHKAAKHKNPHSKPALHPLIGPDEINMTRNFPLAEKREGESTDHPHHTGLWFCHGRVNGLDFWHKDTITTETLKVSVDDNGVDIVSTHHWQGRDGKPVCIESRNIHLSGNDDQLVIDYHISLKPGGGDVTFGDTKEGSFAIRTHPALKGKAGATMVNSTGGKGKGIWGKKAAWVCYYNKIEGDKVYGITIMDHPTNLRHPTTWHARDYGLLTANPFGLGHFQKAGKGAGDHTIKVGETLDFTYRVIVHRGSDKDAGIAKQFEDWTTK